MVVTRSVWVPLKQIPKTTGEALAINGTSLNGTINADGTATVSIVFSPGSMPMPITAEFTGSNTQSSAQ